MAQVKNHSHVQPPPGITTRLWPQMARLAFIAIAYWLTVRLGLLFVARPEGVASIWPVSGLALAVLLLSTRDQWVKLLAVIFVTNAIGNWSGGNSLPVSLGFALANTLETSLGAWVLVYLCKSKITFGRTGEIFALFGVAIFGNGVTALLGAAVPALAFGAPFLNTWLLWWVSDGLGIILITPVIVAWVAGQNVIHSISPRRLVETALLALVLVMFAWLLFGSFTVAEKPLLRNYMLFPLLIWLAFRYSPRGIAGALLLFAAIAIWNTLQGYGIFAFADQTQTEHLVSLQMFLIVAAFSGLLLSAMVTESKQAETERQVFLDITQGLVATKDLQDFLNLVHNSIAKVIYAENFFVILYNKDTALFEEVYSVDKFDLPAHPARLEKSISAHVFRSGQPFLSKQARFDELVMQGEVELVGTNSPSWLGVPLKTSRETIGVMVVQDYDKLNRYSERDMDFLASIAGQVALVIERKQSEEKLRESEERFRALIEHSHDAITLLTAEGTVLYDSPSIAGILGYGPAERTGRRVFEFVHPEEREGMAHGFAEFAQQMGAVALSEARFIHKDGTPRWIEGVRTNLLHEPPIRAVVVNYRDITERKQAEDALRIAEANYRAIFENAPIGIFQSTPQGQFRSVNPAMARIFGYDSPEEMIASITDIARQLYVDSSNRQEFQHLLAEHGEVLEFIGKNYCKDGSIIWTQTTARTEKDMHGQILYYEGFLIDITERKRAEDALRESEEKFRTMANQSPLMIGVTDESGNITFLNKKWLDFRGRTLEEEVGWAWAAELHPQDREATMSAMQSAIEHHEQYSVEYRILDRFGDYHWILDTAAPLLDSVGRLQGYIGSALDITERKQAEDELQKLASVVQYSSELVNLATLDGRMIFLNEAGSKMLGINPAEVGQHTIMEVIPEQWLEIVQSELMPTLMEKGRWEGDLQYRNIQTNVVTDVHALAFVIKDAKSGAPLYLANASLDITERKRAEDALRENEQRYRLIFDGVEDAIFVETLDGRILDVNRCACEMFGYSHEQFLTKTVADIVPSEDNIVTFIPNDPSSLFDHPIETVNMRANGEKFPIEISIRPQELNGENFLFVVGRDITARKRAEEEILEKSSELEALFTVSSHLRTAQTADDMLPVVLEQMSKVLNADANAVILLDPDQTHFTYVIGDGLLTSNTGLQFNAENSISGHILQTRQPYVTLDFANDPLRSRAVRDSEGIGPMILVPLQSETEFIGTLVSARAKDSPMGPFTSTEVKLLVSIGEMFGNALRRAHLYDAAISRLQRVQGLRSIDSFISANMDIKITLKLIVNQTLSLMNVDAAAILLYNPNLHMLEYATAQGFHYKDIEKARFDLGNTFSERAIMERRIIIASNPSNVQDPVHKEMMQKEGFASCCITPMIAKGKVLGVLELYNRTPLHSDQEWLDFLEALGGQAAIAIDNARLFRDLQTSNLELTLAYDATIQGWSQALDLKDRETEGHTLRVTEATIGIAKLVGLSENEIMHIRRGALLHDIGKMGIPDHILNKTGKLTPKEWDIIRQHPQYAYDMLRPIEFLHPALDIPYSHHEKWDGTGYPQGLKNLQIPYAARLFAVVDVWDALTSDRIYRKAWPKKKVFAYIKEQSGKHFDPQVVEFFLKYADTIISRKK